METEDVTRIAGAAEQHLTELSDRHTIIEYVQNFVDTGESYGYHPSRENIDDYAKLFGLETLEAKIIVGTYFNNLHAINYVGINTEPSLVDMPMSVSEMLQSLGNAHMSDDYPNGFFAGIIVQLDETTCLAFGLRNEEMPGICDDCRTDELEMQNFDSGFSCDHADYEYEANYWFLLVRPDAFDSIDWETGDLRG